MKEDHKHPRKILVFLVILTGGFLIFRMRHGICMHLKAIEVRSNVGTVTLSTNNGDDNQVGEPRRRAIKALFISKNTLSFCKRTIHESLTGKDDDDEIRGMHFLKHKIISRYQLIFVSQICHFFLSVPDMTSTRITLLPATMHLFTEPTRVMAYCQVPKAGSTTWRNTFANMNAIKDGGIRQRSQKLYSKKNSFRAKTFGDLANLNGLHIVKFMFVRHPFERLVSAYNDKFVIYRNATRFQKVCKLMGKDVEIGELYLNLIRSYQESYMNMTSSNPCFANSSLEFKFSCFIEYVLDSANNEKLPSHIYSAYQIHWWLFTEICRVCYVQYDLIGHIENFQEDLQILLTKFHNNKFLIELYKNKTKSRCFANCKETKNESYLKYLQQLTKGTIMRLYRRYKNDFEFGGYDFPMKYIASGT